MTGECSTDSRRAFLKWLSYSPLLSPATLLSCGSLPRSDKSIQNTRDLQRKAREALGPDAAAYLEGGADDMRTVSANEHSYRRYQIRARRLVDVREIDTTMSLLGSSMRSPIFLAPVGLQGFFHEDAEPGTARAADRLGHVMVASSVSNASIGEIARASSRPPWFQLYPTPNREVTRGLLQRAADAGCTVCVLTVDTPIIGNREGHSATLLRMLGSGEMRMGNYEGLRNGEDINDPSMTWSMIDWLRSHTQMKIVLKGIVTAEDAEFACDYGADGVIVSNHGGRQLESDRATVDCLAEVVQAVQGRMPVMIDGGIRRGTDVFKALALGADAVGVGRPYCWGLAAFGSRGVEQALEILHAELVRAMQLAGTPRLQDINRTFVTAP